MPKKILQILPALNEGGVERGVFDICSYARKVNFEHEVLVASSGGKFANKLDEAGISHFTFDLKSKNPLKIFSNIFRIIKICKDNNVGLIHARSRAPAWSAYIASKILGITFFTTFHGFYKITSPFKKFYNSVMARGDKVIAVSEFIKKHIIENYKIDGEKITVIHRGIDTDYFNPQNVSNEEVKNFRVKYNLQGKKIILLVGRITRWKAQDIAIKALSKIEDKNVVLLVIGSAEKGREDYFNEIKQLVADLSITDKVLFLGSSDNLPLLYKSCDIAVNCSREPETFGRVTAEAGAFGKPVIATNIGGSLEIIKENETGFLVNPDDETMLARKIEEVLSKFSDEDYAQNFSAKTRERIINNFSLKQMCKKNFVLYKFSIK